MAALDIWQEREMPWIAMAAADVPKVSPRPVDALVYFSSVRWMGLKHPVHFFHVYYAAGLPSHSGRYFGKDFAVRRK